VGLRQNALVLAVLTVLIAIVGDWTGVPVLRNLWCLPAGLLLLGLAYERWFAKRSELQLTLASRVAVLGKSAEMNWSWAHALSRPIQIEFAPAAPEGFTLDTAVRYLRVQCLDGVANAEQNHELAATVTIPVTPRQLGTHAWPAIHARIAGPLGLAWWSQRVHCEFSLRVAPDMLSSADHRLAASAAGRKALQRKGSGTEVLQLRDYQPGDSLHLIDWKASARAKNFISRDFTEDQHLEVILAIDAGRASQQRCGSLDRLGHYVNVAARFAEHAVAHDDRVGLIIFADRPLSVLPPGRGNSAVLRIRRLLSAVEPARAESNPLHAAMRIASLAKHRALIIMLTDLDDATVASQLAAATRLLLPKHLPFIAGLVSPAAQDLAQITAKSWLDPYHALAAQEYCLRLQRNVRALHSLGAPALAAHPDQLEKAVFAAYEGFRAKRRV
jgi:uncharacterized protein (DUF58 family)